jgi:hypothetical protein
MVEIIKHSIYRHSSSISLFFQLSNAKRSCVNTEMCILSWNFRFHTGIGFVVLVIYYLIKFDVEGIYW